MSNIFSYLVRDTGGYVPFNTGTGPIIGGVKSQHLWLDTEGAVYAVIDGIIDHWGAGLPFDADGRLVVSSDAASYFSQALTFTASGALAVTDTGIYFDQGVVHGSGGTLGGTGLGPSPPRLNKPIDDVTVNELDLPDSTNDMSTQLASPGTGTGLTWSLTGNPAEITINGSTGILTIADTAAVDTYIMDLVVTTSDGTDSDTFNVVVEVEAALTVTGPDGYVKGTADDVEGTGFNNPTVVFREVA